MEKSIKIDGMSCEHCVKAVEKNLSKLNLNNTDVKIGTADVEYDETIIKEEDIIKAIEEAGYNVIN